MAANKKLNNLQPNNLLFVYDQGFNEGSHSSASILEGSHSSANILGSLALSSSHTIQNITQNTTQRAGEKIKWFLWSFIGWPLWTLTRFVIAILLAIASPIIAIFTSLHSVYKIWFDLGNTTVMKMSMKLWLIEGVV
ncbi:MAG: hypothetical protein GY821_13820 [Gammaproteobacteria bacterium]|nr:hypothetical protein [Gammaproteobacteria bacterium]